MGRPRGVKVTGDHVVHTRINANLYDRLEQHAKARGITVHAAVLHLLERAILAHQGQLEAMYHEALAAHHTEEARRLRP